MFHYRSEASAGLAGLALMACYHCSVSCHTDDPEALLICEDHPVLY